MKREVRTTKKAMDGLDVRDNLINRDEPWVCHMYVKYINKGEEL
jgi:hypothetical protein